MVTCAIHSQKRFIQMINFLILIGFIFTFLATNTAHASAFCVVGSGFPQQCIYDDVRTCIGASNPPNTACITNSESYIAFSGSSNYCVVQSSVVAQCLYIDRSQCNQEASRSGGICVERTAIETNNPYQFDPRIQGN